VSLIISIAAVFTVPVFASQTKIYVDPPSIINPGLTPPQTFSITVKIFNVTNLYGYDFQLFYDTTILNGTTLTIPSNHFLKPVDPSKLFIVKQVIEDDYNSTHGRVWVAMTLINPEPSKTGSGILVTVTFKVTGIGSCALDLYNTKLSDPDAKKIDHTAEDGYFNNISPSTLYVSPATIINPDLVECTNFTIDINVRNVVNLYSWEFKLYYSNEILNATSAIEGPFLKSSGSTSFQIKEFNDNFNATHGLVWIACALLAPPPVSGNGTLATISFHVEALGESALDLSDTMLSDPWEVPIPHEVIDGYFNNILLAHLYVDPPSIIDPTLLPPANFTIDIMIANVTNLCAYEFKLNYNTAILNCFGLIIFPFPNQTHYTTDLRVDDSAGYVWVKVAYYPPTEPLTTTSPVALAKIFFQVTGLGASVLDLNSTKLNDCLGQEITHKVSDGYICIVKCDVAVLDVVVSTNAAYVGWGVKINVTVGNEGDIAETFNVSAYYDDFLIGTLTVTDLASGMNTTLTFIWDTKGVAPCHNYTIKAEASVVPYEMDLADNIYIDGKVKIKMLGDANGDGAVDIYDLVIAANSFGRRSGDPGWDERADFNRDGLIDVFDLVIAAVNFGKTC
jgi:hypothetical protein